MVNIIVQLSKYLMILMITVYTYLCFSIFGYYDPDKKKQCLRKQNVLMFVMHLTAFLVMYLEKKDTKILALYLMQVTLLGGTILLYSFIYPKVSRLVVNNMCMLLSIGFIMITRLNYDKAAKQYLIAAAGIVLCLVIPIIIRKVRFLSEWRILYGIVGIVSPAYDQPHAWLLIRQERRLWRSARQRCLWCDAWFYGCGNQYSAVGAGEDRICVLCSIQF